jgi:two-component system, chemotaxis family, sensor kinase CheA
MTDDFIREFKNEALGILSSLEGDLLKLENNKGNQKLIDTIFRGMHTLKGTAGMFGFDGIEKITHNLESAYNEIREGIQQTDDHLLGYSFASVDIIRKILSGSIPEEEINKHISAFSVHNEVPNQQKSETPKWALYAIVFKPSEQVMKRGLNPLKILEEISNIGRIAYIVHNNNIDIELQLAQNKLVSWWEIFLKTDKTIDDVKSEFIFYRDDEYAIYNIPNAHIGSNKDFLERLKQELGGKEIMVSERDSMIKELLDDALDETAPTELVEQANTVEIKNNVEEKEEEKQDQVTVNVSSKKLDEMMELVSNLVTIKSELALIAGTLGSSRLLNVVEKIERLSKQFRDNAIDIRLVPIASIEVQLRRLARDLGQDLGKKVDFVTEGMHTELDKTIISALEKPLVHIIRNSIDHGIESPSERAAKNKKEAGVIKFVAFYSGSNVYVQVQDDGAGINLEKVKETAIKKGYIKEKDNPSEKELLNLIVNPGFTTAKNVSMVSGRGVGMDVVQREIATIRGELEINTEKDLGTIISIKLPLTLSIIDTLHFTVEGRSFLIPVTDIEFVYEEKESVLFSDNTRQLNYKGALLPFLYLKEIFGIEHGYQAIHNVLIINKDDRRFALLIDHILGEHQAVIRNFGSVLGEIGCFIGSSVLGDGNLALIIDASNLYLAEQTAKKAYLLRD